MCFLSQVLGMSKTCHTVCSMILMSFEWDAMCLHLPRCVISFQTDTVFPHLTQTGMLPCVEVILIQHVLHRNPPPPFSLLSKMFCMGTYMPGAVNMCKEGVWHRSPLEKYVRMSLWLTPYVCYRHSHPAPIWVTCVGMVCCNVCRLCFTVTHAYLMTSHNYAYTVVTPYLQEIVQRPTVDNHGL